MKYLIDTNIFLDVMLNRVPLVESSKQILKLCETKKIHGFITASTVTDLYYLLNKDLKNKDATYKNLGYILDIASVISVTGEDILQTYLLRADDFEDALLALCAKRDNMNGIITRNIDDFTGFDIPIFTPEEFLARS